MSGEGSKSSAEEDPFSIECPDATFTTGELDFNVRIPSYAEEPITFVLAPDPICPNSDQTVTFELINGNDAGALDEWGNLKDTFHIHVHMVKNASGAGGQMVTPVATVSWK